MSSWRFWLLWMLASFAGAAAGLVLAFPLNAILVAALGEGKLGPWTTTETALIVVFKGAESGVMGLGMGLGQWLVLRRRVSYARWWIAISIAGWVFALALYVATAIAGLLESPPGIVFFAVFGLVPSAVAGGGMVWLLRQTAPGRQVIAS